MLERFRRFRRTITIKRKLLLINMIVAILPVIAFSIIITNIYNDTVNKRTKESVGDTSIVIADRIVRVFKDTENCSNYLTVNINKIIKDQEPSAHYSLAIQKAITNELYVAKIVFDELDSIAFISADDSLYVSDNLLLANQDQIISSEQLMKLKETSGKSIWFPCEKRDFLVQNAEEAVVTLGKKVIEIESGQTLGYLFLNVDMSAIEGNLQNQLINYWLVDADNTIISSAVRNEYIEKYHVDELLQDVTSDQVKNHNGKRYYLSTYSIEDYGSRLISIIDLDEFNVEAKKILYLLILISVGVVFSEIILSNYLTKKITSPLLKLKNGAEEIAGGNMSLRLNFKSEDEIGQLGKSFNHMAEQVQELLVKVDYEARKKKEYELSLLQQQVKPHFLYNNLDIIVKLSEMNRNAEARRATRKLADYYRNSLSDSKEIITIEQEMKITGDYLELQKIRYRDLFTYEFIIDDAILSMLIPKLTLQPLIENAIYHGLKYKEQTGSVRVIGYKTEDGIFLSVTDDGVGMSKEHCRTILKNNPEGHFGVYSVNHRIKLFFGEEYGIKVSSEEGKGTTVDIYLPAKENLLEEENLQKKDVVSIDDMISGEKTLFQNKKTGDKSHD
ncbi:MAG: sensor histidine kinase [Mobilitalea sp.]